MKKNYLILILLFVATTSVNLVAQKRSKLPRIKVKAETQSQTESNRNISPLFNNPIEERTVSQSFIEPIQEANTEIVSINHEEERNYQTRPTIVFQKQKNSISDSQELPDMRFQINTLRNHNSLLKVKDVKKTALELWVILLIVFYILGLAFTILCVLALLLWANYTMFIVFLVLALVFSLAGSIMLTLGQLGVM
ncbi:MAG: hypothetical protein IAE67_03175 [Candidatus Competibacteraceae bacterium]|nr:hypothetical protein [Candidatus Competibacteraceae bacterium]